VAQDFDTSLSKQGTFLMCLAPVNLAAGIVPTTLSHTNEASDLHKQAASDHEEAAKHHRKAAECHDQNKLPADGPDSGIDEQSPA
jgi:hypothetical protein